MSEVEFERLLDAVRNGAICARPRPSRTSWQALPMSGQPSNPANDNGLAWPLIPFPEVVGTPPADCPDAARGPSSAFAQGRAPPQASVPRNYPASD